MNITSDKNVMVFKNKDGFYSISLSRKNNNDEWESAYFPVRFGKDVSIENKTLITIKEAWLSFYVNEKDEKKYTNFYIFINKYDKVKSK